MHQVWATYTTALLLQLSIAVMAYRPPHATGPAAYSGLGRSPASLPAPPPKPSTIDCEQKPHIAMWATYVYDSTAAAVNCCHNP